MFSTLVLTLIGKDRAGLVEAVSRAVVDQQGNWLSSRMARLAGQFAGILEVSVPSERAPALRQALAALAADGLQVTVTGSEEVDDDDHGRELLLEVVGQDRPGIVQQISTLLASASINVEELATRRVDAPMSGEYLFHAEARLRVPASVTPASLRAQLEAIGNDLMVDVTLEEPAR